jgi:hypothetical protein
MIYFYIWLIGLGVIWIAAAGAAEKEPTSHGQGIIVAFGCALGLLWPLFLAYLIVASPWIAWTWWQTRDERA